MTTSSKDINLALYRVGDDITVSWLPLVDGEGINRDGERPMYTGRVVQPVGAFIGQASEVFSSRLGVQIDVPGVVGGVMEDIWADGETLTRKHPLVEGALGVFALVPEKSNPTVEPWVEPVTDEVDEVAALRNDAVLGPAIELDAVEAILASMIRQLEKLAAVDLPDAEFRTTRNIAAETRVLLGRLIVERLIPTPADPGAF